MKTVEKSLFELCDPKYREFHKNLVPNIPADRIIGVRIPEIRKLALRLDPELRSEFLAELPHRYYDENILHAAVLCNITDFNSALHKTELFLPYIDNWAVCDALSPKAFAKHRDELLEHIRRWMGSDKTYTVRFGIGMLMRHYLDGDFKPEYLDWAAEVRSEEYYVNMMTAWYFATALAKQWDSAVRVIEDMRLDPWTHDKAIQKACESFRIKDEQKDYLRGLRVKRRRG